MGGETADHPQKRIAGSSKMAADSGSMIWVGKPLNQKMAGAEDKKRDRLNLISFFFNNKLDVQGWFFLFSDKKMS